MLLEEDLVWGGVSFHPPCTPRVDEGICVSVRIGAVPRLPVYCLISSEIDGIEIRPPLGFRPRAVQPSAACPPGSPWCRLLVVARRAITFEGGLGRELAPPGAVVRHGSPFG